MRIQNPLRTYIQGRPGYSRPDHQLSNQLRHFQILGRLRKIKKQLFRHIKSYGSNKQHSQPLQDSILAAAGRCKAFLEAKNLVGAMTLIFAVLG